MGSDSNALPIPRGQVWNMTYDAAAAPGWQPEVSPAEIWERYAAFLDELLPVAVDADVRLALHPDDPPVPVLRGAARLCYGTDQMQRVLDLHDNAHHCLEFCQGTVAEMQGADIYQAIDRFCRSGRIAYVHFRNVNGKVPRYTEVFLDEGDVDMSRALGIYARHGFDGVFVPDHTPQMSCAGSWYAGMAYAIGYFRALLSSVGRE
jgi:mannonate dehydratase